MPGHVRNVWVLSKGYDIHRHSGYRCVVACPAECVEFEKDPVLPRLPTARAGFPAAEDRCQGSDPRKRSCWWCCSLLLPLRGWSVATCTHTKYEPLVCLGRG